jgi:Protein of unknown function (DUF3429)
MPASAILLSVLGLLPFIGCGLAALGPNPESAGRMLTALLAWGALVLAFTGGLQWGMVLREPAIDPPVAPGTEPLIGRNTRIGLAVLPLLLGWVALLLPLVAAAWLALLLLIVSYIAVLVAEHHAARRLVLPARYLWLRWGFTIVTVAMLTTVLTLRLLGQTIVL